MATVQELCGGRRLYTGTEEIWDFGLRLTKPEVLKQMREMGLISDHDPDEDTPQITADKCFLWEFAKAANGGKNPPMSWQLTGSCVNSGAQNAAITRIGIEVCCLPEPATFGIPFTLGAYGKSRGGDGPGEGSSPTEMARALASLGAPLITDSRLPTPKVYEDAFCYTSDIEYQWSAVRNQPSWFASAANPHTFTLVQVRSADEAEVELRRCRPITWAGDWGGLMDCKIAGDGDNKVLWCDRRYTTWNHQQSSNGTWRHPSLGTIFRIHNNWFSAQGGKAVSAHGPVQIPGEVPGGYWIPKKEFDYQCRTGEVFSIRGAKQYDEGKMNFASI